VATTILSLGTDVLIVKRIAGGNDPVRDGGLHMTHTLLAGSFFLLVLLAFRQWQPAFFVQHNLLIGVSVSLLLTFLSSPFKQIANGKEAFHSFAVMTITANAAKAVLLLIAAVVQIFSIHTVINIYIVASLLEWIVGAWLVYLRLGTLLRPYWNKSRYRQLLLESLPQLGVMLFDSALARIDWIILGLVSGAAVTAEYSFAYKIFEISRLPMLVIAPVILPKFVRYLSNPDGLTKEKKVELTLLLKFETAIAVLIPIFFNITWTPLMNLLTAGKYGAVDAPVYMLLSLCVPLHYFNNFLWTMAFAQKQLKLTFYITAVVSILNLILNLLLIPKYSSQGAAIAFVVSTVAQLLLYKLFVHQQKLSVPTMPLFASMAIASACTFLAKYLCPNPLLAALLGLSSYLLLIFLVKMLRLKDFYRLKLILTK
jgi:O-antigen/teichoic acid export membrane protein